MPLFEGISLFGLALATLLPWCAGALAVRALVGPAPATILLGHGYVVGQLLIMLLLLAWHGAGLKLAFLPMAGTLTLATLGATAVLFGRRTSQRRAPALRMRWHHIVWLLPLAWFLWDRGGALFLELSLRPLSAWDAWMNWVPRAVVWFHHGELTPFDVPSAWLQAAPDVELYTLGNWRAGAYPPGIPLLLLWQMLGAGTPDHTLLYLPWLLLPAACALALWGHLRERALAPIITALAVYALLSQPLLNIHVALAGYADLWLGVCFGMGAMALAQWQQASQWRYASLALLMAICCGFLKTPGIIFAGLLVVGIALLAWKPDTRWIAWSTGIAVLLLAAGLAAGMHPTTAAAVRDALVLELPGTLPTLQIQPSPLVPHVWDSFFVHANWHLLWLLLFATLLAAVMLRGPRCLNCIALMMLGAGLGLLLGVFGFTQYYLEAESRVTFNRTVLYLIPLTVFVTFVQLASLLSPDPAVAPEAA